MKTAGISIRNLPGRINRCLFRWLSGRLAKSLSAAAAVGFSPFSHKLEIEVERKQIVGTGQAPPRAFLSQESQS